MANQLVDAVGTAHRPADGAPRIVSLVPSITELLFDLGLGACVVGRTHFCIHPAADLEPVVSVGGTKKISNRKLRSLDPTHVILNVDENTRAMADELVSIVPNLIVTHPIEPEDNLDLYRLIGGIFGCENQAQHLCQRFAGELANLRAVARDRPRRRVLYLIWKDPWMTVSRDTYVSRFFVLAGWDTVAHYDAERYPTIEIKADLLAETDIVLFSSEPYAFTDADIADFATAYPAARSCLPIDGEMTSWYGSRAIEGLGYLRKFAAGAFDA